MVHGPGGIGQSYAALQSRAEPSRVGRAGQYVAKAITESAGGKKTLPGDAFASRTHLLTALLDEHLLESTPVCGAAVASGDETEPRIGTDRALKLNHFQQGRAGVRPSCADAG